MKEEGFSLLEVVVALAIMAGGFLAVLQLYTMSVRSVRTSEKYLKATLLAQSKITELELNNFDVDKEAGEFRFEDGYRWKLEVLPYESPLNSEEENIQLSSIKLIVFWNEDEQEHSVNFYTLNLDGSKIPMLDQRLERIFSGGRRISSPNDSDFDKDKEPSKKNNPISSSSGEQACNPRICGSCSPSPQSQPKCPPGTTFIFGGGCQ